jgi:hypothetical protein
MAAVEEAIPFRATAVSTKKVRMVRSVKKPPMANGGVVERRVITKYRSARTRDDRPKAVGLPKEPMRDLVDAKAYADASRAKRSQELKTEVMMTLAKCEMTNRDKKAVLQQITELFGDA